MVRCDITDTCPDYPNCTYCDGVVNPDNNESEDEEFTGGEPTESNCFLTTACVEYKGLEDNCYELETLRELRDNYMLNNPKLSETVKQYYQIAPKLIKQIKEKGLESKIFPAIYSALVKPSVNLIEFGLNQQAVEHYKKKTEQLQRILKYK